jgi:tRNA 2-thiouridine synthesizing protein A
VADEPKETDMSATVTKTLDFKGLSCPLPIAKTAQAMRELASGDVVEVLATDPGSVPDFQAWSENTGNELIEHGEADGVFRFVIRKV